MRQIVCISTSNYYPVPTRKQNVMNRLKDAEILYIDPPVSLLAPMRDRSAAKRLMAYRRPGRKVRENITVSAPPRFNRFQQISYSKQDKSKGIGPLYQGQNEGTGVRTLICGVIHPHPVT